VTGYVTFKVTDRQVRSTERFAEKRRARDLRLAEDSRRRERILDAYLAVERYLGNRLRPVEHRYGDTKRVRPHRSRLLIRLVISIT
jgi:hypothetical protein